MNISKCKDLFWILIAILWVVVIILGTTGQFVLGLVLCVPLMWLHMMLGFAKHDVVSKRAMIYPFGIWAVMFIICFILCGVYATKYAGVVPPAFLGFHPSFAPVIFLYFIGGVLTISLGYYLFRNDWLDDETWEDFCKEANKIKEGK